MISMATKGVICYREIVSPPVAQTIGDVVSEVEPSLLSSSLSTVVYSEGPTGGFDSDTSGGFDSIGDSGEGSSNGGC